MITTIFKEGRLVGGARLEEMTLTFIKWDRPLISKKDEGVLH